jgi:hypothetical protein
MPVRLGISLGSIALTVMHGPRSDGLFSDFGGRVRFIDYLAAVRAATRF